MPAIPAASQFSSSSSAPNPPAPPSHPKFADILGLNVKFSQGEPSSDLPMLEELGVRWVRDTVGWKALEPEPERFMPLPADFQRRLDFYRAHDIGLVFLLGYGNSTAYPATPEAPYRSVDPVAFGRYAAYVAQTLEQSGVRHVLEIWNEPHNFGLRPLLGGAWNGKPPSRWVDHYVRMVHEAVRQVKKVAPHTKLLSDEDMWILHYWFLEAGLPADLDGFGFHPYTSATSIGPEMTAVGPNTDWVRPFTVVDPDRSFVSAVRRLREQGRAKLGKTPEMWATEWGFAIGQKTPFGPVDEDMLAALLPRAFMVAQAAGVRALCWFSSRDSVDGPMGLTANDGHKRKSYVAFKTLSEQLRAFEFVGQLEGRSHPTRGVQAFEFRAGAPRKLVVWDLDQANTVLQLTGALAGATVIDVLGARVTPQREAGSAPFVRLGSSPLYVTDLQPSTPVTLEVRPTGN